MDGMMVERDEPAEAPLGRDARLHLGQDLAHGVRALRHRPGVERAQHKEDSRSTASLTPPAALDTLGFRSVKDLYGRCLSVDIQTIGVIGAGTMGHGIAQVAAQSGYDVLLVDVAPQALERGVAQIGKGLERLV